MSVPDKDRLRLLVSALRSGEYVQGHGVLTHVEKDASHTDCCLGVACKVAIANGAAIDARVLKADTDSRVAYDEEMHALPRRAMVWYGFDELNPSIEWTNKRFHFKERATLAQLNDEGVPFYQIADLIAWEYAL